MELFYCCRINWKKLKLHYHPILKRLKNWRKAWRRRRSTPSELFWIIGTMLIIHRRCHKRIRVDNLRNSKIKKMQFRNKRFQNSWRRMITESNLIRRYKCKIQWPTNRDFSNPIFQLRKVKQQKASDKLLNRFHQPLQELQLINSNIQLVKLLRCLWQITI